jgi:hypothetical protein
LALRALQADPAARWDLVLFVRFGSENAQLTYQPPSQSAPTEPTGFAVAPDGSFWIGDAGKLRVAHFDGRGRFLGAVRTAPYNAEDVVFSGSTMYVLLSEQKGLIGQVGPGGTRRITVNADGRVLRIAPNLYPDAEGVVVRSVGAADQTSPAQGLRGYARVDVSGSGRATLLPGLPIGRQTFVDLSSDPSDDELGLRYLRGGTSVTQPVRFKLLVRDGSKTKQIPGEFGQINLLPSDGDVSMYVMASPSRPGDQVRYGGSRWLLRMGRSPVLWERLPDPSVPDEAQRRHIANGPGGHVYLMVLTRKGAQIYRRP